MARYNADIQLSPKKPLKPKRVDQDRGEDGEEEEEPGQNAAMAKLLNDRLRRTPTKGVSQEIPQEIHENPPQQHRRKSTFIERLFGFGGSKPLVAPEEVSSKSLENTTTENAKPPENNQVMVDIENLPTKQFAEQEGNRIPSEELQPLVPPESAFQTPQELPEPTTQDPIVEDIIEDEMMETKAANGDLVPNIPPSAPTRLSRPVVGPTNLSKKRKREVVIRDTYDMEGEDHNEDTSTAGDESELDERPKPAKRLISAKVQQAKLPLTRPKTSKDPTNQYVPLKNNIKHTGRVEERQERASVQANSEAPPKPKRGRGRPKKIHNPVNGEAAPATEHVAKKNLAKSPTKANGEIPISSEEPTSDASASKINQLNCEIVTAGDNSSKNTSASVAPVTLHPAVERSVDNTNGEEGGISAILLGPTPEKPSQIPIQPANNVAMTGLRDYSEIPSDQGTRGPSTRVSQPEIPRRIGSMRLGQSFVDHKDLREMVRMMKNIGRKYRRDTGEWQVVRKEQPTKSKAGKKLERRLKRLRIAYDALRTMKDAENPEKGAQIKEASALVDELKIESNCILTDRLGRPSENIDSFETKRTATFLQDLYFNLLPLLTEVVKVGIEANLDQDSTDYSALLELAEILDILYELGAIALKQPENAQPTQKYQIRGPVKTLLPIVRKLRDQFWTEINDQQSKEKRSKDREREAEAEQARDEEEQIAEAERFRRIKNIRKQQKSQLKRIFADPLLGRAMRAATEKELMKDVATHSGFDTMRQTSEDNQSRASRWIQVRHNDGVDDDPFADDEIVRVEVFGKNNKQEDHRRPWTEGDKKDFVDIMQAKDGEEDRYQIAANSLNRSIEEIFESAKDLQEAMDGCHANGQMNRVHDRWTYAIWVEERQ